ncbi:SAM-dependent methyltransferase [Saccharopolyspora flava]|uniref:S-adenosyl methyltransferase n=1 Tax=Saccharopolyspora flava TaxID=95161 RepID=A0A1I6TU55_9PSEU|nr:SAM-dependent methyltransferase [Saccharopolyspora flava]SFS92701.1 S-adenosyl methyltransferase [Saccharopolyspora flava]
MSDTSSWDGGDLDVETPNAARMYDYYLGGSHNFASDRAAAARAVQVTPTMIPGARANRAFLQRAVRFFLDAGIRQFLDLGSGIPTVGHVHEIAHAVDPSARVAYVDIEPIAVAHTRRMLSDTPTVTVTQADLQDPQEVLNSPGVAELLDFAEPVAVLAVAVLHFVPDEKNPAAMLDAYCDAVAPGSFLAVSHITDHYDTPERVAEIDRLYSSTTNAARHRTFEDFKRLIGDRELVPPGAVYATDWRPDPGTVPAEGARTGFWAAVARIP